MNEEEIVSCQQCSGPTVLSKNRYGEGFQVVCNCGRSGPLAGFPRHAKSLWNRDIEDTGALEAEVARLRVNIDIVRSKFWLARTLLKRFLGSGPDLECTRDNDNSVMRCRHCGRIYDISKTSEQPVKQGCCIKSNCYGRKARDILALTPAEVTGEEK